ncbi:MAG TPA: hypothetical protein PKD85_17785, partial [Saprospiraceae bacterium]|nr:hypothetical protein [Saprospiraceae bacterium]
HDREFLEGLTSKTYEFINHNVTEHLGDINYFLERKKYGDVRDIDSSSPTSAVETNTKIAAPLDREEQKKIKRRLQYLERDIESTEKQIAEWNQMMVDPSFYMKPEFSQVAKKLDDAQKKLEILMSDWEEAAEMAESIK